METIDYRDLLLWRPNTETPYYISIYVYRPYQETLYRNIYKSFCKMKLIAKKTNLIAKRTN